MPLPTVPLSIGATVPAAYQEPIVAPAGPAIPSLPTRGRGRARRQVERRKPRLPSRPRNPHPPIRPRCLRRPICCRATIPRNPAWPRRRNRPSRWFRKNRPPRRLQAPSSKLPVRKETAPRPTPAGNRSAQAAFHRLPRQRQGVGSREQAVGEQGDRSAQAALDRHPRWKRTQAGRPDARGTDRPTRGRFVPRSALLPPCSPLPAPCRYATNDRLPASRTRQWASEDDRGLLGGPADGGPVSESGRTNPVAGGPRTGAFRSKSAVADGDVEISDGPFGSRRRTGR